MKAAPARGTEAPASRKLLTDADRRSALIAFANGTSGHQWDLDDLCDDVIYAAETGHLPRGKGLDAEDRTFVRLLYLYSHEINERRAKLGVRM